MGLRWKLALSLGAVIVVTFALVYFATSSLATSMLAEQEARSLAQGTEVMVEVLYTLAQDQEELNSALASAAEKGGMETVQVLDERLETVSPSRCTPAEILVGMDVLRSLAGHDEVRLVHSPSLGAVFALMRPLPGGGFLFSARSAVDFVERKQSVVALLVLWGALVILAVLLAGSILLRNIIVRPIEKLVKEAGSVATGGSTSGLSTLGGDEFGVLASSLSAMAGRIRDDRVRIECQVSELTQVNQKLSEATEQLIRTEKLASVGQLAAGVAHEIGNPIGITLGYVEMLEDGSLDEPSRRDAVAQIRKATERIRVTIRDLLDFSRPASDEQDRSDVVEESLEIMNVVRPQPRFRNVKLDLDNRLGNDSIAAMPPSRYKQVLLNLLINAADAMEGSGRIVVGLSRADGGIRASVSDSGPGVDPSVLLRIFDPFFTTKGVGKGTGLGLFVCHSIVTRYGGRIEVGRCQEGGACFSMILPKGE